MSKEGIFIAPVKYMNPAREPSNAVVTLSTANTEYDHQLPVGCKKFTLHCRDGTAFRLSYKQGTVASSDTPYFTVKANTSYYEDGLDVGPGVRLYFACASASKEIEIIQWI